MRTGAMVVVITLLATACLLSAADPPSAPATQPASRPAERPIALTAPEVEQLLDELSVKLGDLTSVWASFRQSKHLSLLRDPMIASGALLFVSPDRVRFEYSKPYRSVTLVTGLNLQRYEWFGKRWRRIESPQPAMRQVVRQIASWMRGRFRQDENIYLISATRTGKSIRLTLTPRSVELGKLFKRIELALSTDRTHVTEVSIIEDARDRTVIRFVQQRRNVKIPAELFAAGPDGPRTLPAMPKPAAEPASKPATRPTSRPSDR